LDSLDLARSGHVIAAGNEFESQEVALDFLSLPDFGETAFA
jgi:hypothetical protein